jgi:UPF0716 protein FxsA
MALLLLLLFVVIPIAELAVIVAVAQSIGVLNTIGLVILVSIIGAWLAKREGLGMFTRVRASLDRGELPSKEVADGFLILFAGALMLAPGFLTDICALLLLLPPTRAVVRTALVSYAVKRGRVAMVSTYGTSRGGPSAAGVWDVESWEDTPGRSPDAGRELGGKA